MPFPMGRLSYLSIIDSLRAHPFAIAADRLISSRAKYLFNREKLEFIDKFCTNSAVGEMIYKNFVFGLAANLS